MFLLYQIIRPKAIRKKISFKAPGRGLGQRLGLSQNSGRAKSRLGQSCGPALAWPAFWPALAWPAFWPAKAGAGTSLMVKEKRQEPNLKSHLGALILPIGGCKLFGSGPRQKQTKRYVCRGTELLYRFLSTKIGCSYPYLLQIFK